ncbi:MAG: DUF1189 domain-containing protein [Calditrichaeota bacterium]|nr:DUF1189 domain-containing protein [Calditrichota bacterium]
MHSKQYKKLITLSLLLINVLVIFFVWEHPAMRNLLSTVELYRKAFDAPLPEIIVHSKGITLDGKLPTRIRLRNNIWLIFDTYADSTEFLSCAPRSIWISNDLLLYRTVKGIKTFKMKNIRSDDPPETISGEKIHVHDKFEKYYRPGKLLLNAFLILSTFISLFLLMLLGGGVGIIIDAFREGPATYAQMLHLAGRILTVWVIIAAGIERAGLFSLKMPAAFLLFYLLSIALLVSWNLNHKINAKTSI